MKGTEKQIAWAEQIISDALGTINRNIARIKKQIEKYGADKHSELELKAWEAARGQYENVILKSAEAQNAAWIIDNRKRMDPAAIAHQVEMIVANAI